MGVAVTVGKIGVPFASNINVGVSVGGARVGMGAWVGVAMRVLTGKNNVGGAVGGTYVGTTSVGICMTTVAGGGVATSVGRTKKLNAPKPYRQLVTSKTTPAQPVAHCRRGVSA